MGEMTIHIALKYKNSDREDFLFDTVPQEWSDEEINNYICNSHLTNEHEEFKWEVL